MVLMSLRPTCRPSSPVSRRSVVSRQFVMACAVATIVGACGGGLEPPTEPSEAEPAVIESPPRSNGGSSTPHSTDQPMERQETVPPIEAGDDAEGGADRDNLGPPAVTLTPLVAIDQPIAMTTNPSTQTPFVASKAGSIHIIDLDGGALGPAVLDLSGLISTGPEQGLLGMVFAPDSAHLYVNYTDRSGDTIVAEYPTVGDEIQARRGRVVLRVNQPAGNHNGGHLTFGPDGLLYIGLGDGGGAGDRFGNGQNTESLLGAILRIAPTARGDAPYAVPSDNPFVDHSGADEILVWGVRNPWRFSFDSLTGDLWIADVGQNQIEEVTVLWAADLAQGGGWNLGWPDVEGSVPFNNDGPPSNRYVGPVYQYDHSEGCSVTGGFVYRGTAIPSLFGHYVFGDWCTSVLWSLPPTADIGSFERIELGGGLNPNSLLAFGQDNDGELYVLAGDGTIYRIDPM